MKNRKDNIIKMTDSYKPSHSKLYKKGTTYMQSYLESRVPEEYGEKVMLFGLQYFIKEYLTGRIVSYGDVVKARNFFESHFGRDDVFDEEGWKHIVKRYDGRLPVKIYAQPEGKPLDTRTPLIVVESTDPQVFWLVNYLETILAQVWYPSTIATNSYNAKKTIRYYMKETSELEGEDLEGALGFKLHDFGYRGVSSVETAGLGGMAHLVNFLGTDNLRGLEFADHYYGEDMAGFSIPASEHSTMTAWGGREGEADAMENMLDTYPDGLIACVSDSYDIIHAIKNIWGDQLKEKVLNRDGTLVVRPDSGDPIVATLKVFEALWEAFGGDVNSKGYRVLNSKVRMIQGDGIDLDMLETILDNFKRHNISAENITFGSGGGLLQKFNRDTFKFAFKCNQVITNGEEMDVRKFPKEFDSDGNYVESNKFSKGGDLKSTEGLELVFENGYLVKEQKFEDVRNNATTTADMVVA